MADRELESTLELLASQHGSAIPFPLHRIEITKTGANFADNQRLLDIFQQAFPDEEFEVSKDEQGRPGIRSKPKLTKASVTGQPVPEGYSVSIAEQGIKDLQTSLENEKDDEKRFEIASRLNTMIQTQKAYRFNEYKQRAEAEFGVPDLLGAIDGVKRAELASRFNPGTGMPSAERMQLLESLGVARARASSRIQEMMSLDPVLTGAEALVKGTIAEIQGKTVLEGRRDIIEQRNIQKQARVAAISSLDPNFLEAVSIIRFNKVIPELTSIAEQIVDKKIALNEVERMLASADTETLKQFYIQAKNPKDKALTLQILEAKERNVVGDDAQARRNIKLFSTLAEKNLSAEDDRSIPPEIRRRYKQAQTEVTAQAAASGRTRDELLAERTVAIKRELLSEVIKGAFYQDMSSWNGLIRSDQAAQEIIRQAGKDKLNLKQFVDKYFAHNDGRSFADKGKALQAIMVSGTEALPRSAVLPIPSSESVLLEAQRILAQASMNYYYSNPTMPGGYAFGGAPFEDFWRQNVIKGRGQ